MTYKKQSGRTMMEMIGVLAIMGLIAYGALNGINSGMTSYKVNQLYIEVNNIVKGVQDMYLSVFGRNGYGASLTCDTLTAPSSDGCKLLINNGVLPGKDDTSTIRELKISVATDNFSIEFQGKKEVCEGLREMDWKSQSIECLCSAGFMKCTDSDGDDSNQKCCKDNKLTFKPK